ncbi:MAG: hypothetical protein H6883_09290 [Rhodobiaceae bacterium]|nr:hypothetical protein [Rhodobiaceae bacterium]MCC0056320.1 hypothetical protein [Rhodobiaceae bacterium]
MPFRKTTVNRSLFSKACLPALMVAAVLAAPLTMSAPALAANTDAAAQKVQANRELADKVADRLYRQAVEYEIYLAFWPAIEKQLREVKPDIPTWDLAKSQLIARRLAGEMYNRTKTPLLDAIVTTFDEKEMKQIVDIPPGESAAEEFGRSELGQKVKTKGSKAVSDALNNKMLQLVKAEGDNYAVEVMRAAIEEGILPPPPQSAQNPGQLPLGYGPVSPVPPIPITPPKR